MKLNTSNNAIFSFANINTGMAWLPTWIIKYHHSENFQNTIFCPNVLFTPNKRIREGSFPYHYYPKDIYHLLPKF